MQLMLTDLTDINRRSAKTPGPRDEFDPIFDGLQMSKIHQSVPKYPNKVLKTSIPPKTCVPQKSNVPQKLSIPLKASVPQKRSAQGSDTNAQPKRICLPLEKLSQSRNIPPSGARIASRGATTAHTQNKDRIGEVANKDREEKAESKSSPNFRVLTQRFEAAVNDAARASQLRPTNTSEHGISHAVVAAPDPKSDNVSCKVESDNIAGTYEDLRPERFFQLGEEIPLAETQMWKAYYRSMLIE